MRFEKSVTVKASPEDVYNYVADFSRHGEWGGHGLAIETPGGPVSAGFTVQSTAQQFGKQRESLTVTEASPGRRFAFESKGGLGIVLNAFDIEPDGDGSRLVKSQDFIKPSLLCRLMTLMVSSQRPKELAGDVDRIKQKLEA